MAKMLYRKDTGEILGVHIIGLHAADLIHEASNAIATKQHVQVCVGQTASRFCVLFILPRFRSTSFRDVDPHSKHHVQVCNAFFSRPFLHIQ